MVNQERLPRQPQAGSAGARVLGYAGTQSVGAVSADEPSVLVCDHRPEVDVRHAMRAADDQDRVGQSCHGRSCTRAMQKSTQDSRRHASDNT